MLEDGIGLKASTPKRTVGCTHIFLNSNSGQWVLVRVNLGSVIKDMV